MAGQRKGADMHTRTIGSSGEITAQVSVPAFALGGHERHGRKYIGVVPVTIGDARLDQGLIK
jgi:hypothetical protein